MNTTSLTLLERLKAPKDEEAWSRFVRLYTPLLYYWCRRMGLREQDAADLVQDVLTQMVRKLPEFKYEATGSFRNWLRVVTVNKWRERQRKRGFPLPLGGEQLEQVPDDGDAWVLEEKEYRQHLVRSALPLIQPEFNSTSWQAFEEHVLKQRGAAEVAEELGVRIGTVYAVKSRVLTRLRQELARFLDE